MKYKQTWNSDSLMCDTNAKIHIVIILIKIMGENLKIIYGSKRCAHTVWEETQTWNHFVCLRAASAWRHLPRESTSRSNPPLAASRHQEKGVWPSCSPLLYPIRDNSRNEPVGQKSLIPHHLKSTLKQPYSTVHI